MLNIFNLKVRLVRAQFAILMLGMLLQRSPAVRLLVVLEKALSQPFSQVVRLTTYVATAMGVFHATAGATGLVTSRDSGSSTSNVDFKNVEVGKPVSLSLQLDGVLVDYWEIDFASDLVDGLDFVSDKPGEIFEGPFEREDGPNGVNKFYRIKSQFLILTGAPTTPSRIATLEPDGYFANQNVLSIKAYDAQGNSERGWYPISIEVPLVLPEIVRDPVVTRVPVGGRAQFFFESSGVVDSVQWLKDNVELSGETGMTLIIQNVSAADEGVYSVRVGNSAGTATSGGGALTIDDASADLVNLATRGLVGAGGDIMIGGLTVLGGSTKTVLVRGLGPQLAAEGVPGALADPELRVFQTLFDETPIRSQMLVTNDNWEEDSNAVELEAALISLNKPLAAGSKDAALLLTLNEGVYTFQLSGVGDTEGVGLIELFVVE